jgi:hypothetical protein
MIFTTVLQWSISIASKNDLDDQSLLLATVPIVGKFIFVMTN